MTRNIRKTTLTALVLAAALAGLPASPAGAYTTAPTPAVTTTTVASGAGNQTDPHISGNLASYSNFVGTAAEIRYQDLATGHDAAIPNGGHRDAVSDVSGTTIVFRRVYTDGSTATRPILAFDAATAGSVVELDPKPDVRRQSPSIGGRTVAWMELNGGSSIKTEVVVYDRDTGVATPLSADGELSNRDPAVSPDGSVVTWAKCDQTGVSCDVYRAARDGTAWNTMQLTDAPGDETQPATNGEQVVYASGPGSDRDIAWKPIDGGAEQRLELPGRQSHPTVSGDLVVFSTEPSGSTIADLWAYDLGTDVLYRLTDTPDTDETLADVSHAPDGTVRVVWAQPDGTLGNNDIHAMSFRLDANQAPDCADVAPSTARLWPPHHQLEQVTVAGATDPDGDSVTLTVTAVTQDEPVDGLDDGTTAPDAQLSSSPDQVRLRAERSGTGDGRVYRVAFTAADPTGATCSGVADVSVPLNKDGTAVDSGGTHNSLVT